MAGRKRRRDGLRLRRYECREVAPNLLQATPEAVIRAMARVPPDLDWATLSEYVLPMFPRRRPMPPQAPDPLRVALPPGVLTGFGVDIGPAFLHIHEDLLTTWRITRDELVERAMANLLDRARRTKPRDVQVIDLDHVAVRSFQSHEGWASTLLLLPHELRRVFGAERQCFIAPMRDVLLSFPADVDRLYLAHMNEEFAEIDPNSLALEAFLLANGRLTCEPLLLEAALA